MSNSTDQHTNPKKLVLCFDGTSNKFTGSSGDTNVVKILNELDRGNPSQCFYYQTGIGTYGINEASVNKSTLGSLRNRVSMALDSGFGTTFDAHVTAGYRFLMRYYETGDKIYLFGFSRGAFTAKFLARMLSTVGLLCRGNEEMVPFAYSLYQKYLEGEVALADKIESKPSDSQDETRGNPSTVAGSRIENAEETQNLLEQPKPVVEEDEYDDRDVFELASDEVKAFSKTFCRQELVHESKEVKYSNVKVFFLGMWDCVASVAVLEQKAPKPMPVVGTASYVRHAIAIDERRVKFKAALLSQDQDDGRDRKMGAEDGRCIREDVKEVWFVGNHGDVGGGWPVTLQEKGQANLSGWQRVRHFWRTNRAQKPTRNILNDPFQLSDIPLAWMIREVQKIGQVHPEAALHFRKDKYGFMPRFEGAPNYETIKNLPSPPSLDKPIQNQTEALNGMVHDTLSTQRGTGLFKVLLWKMLEYLPFITRWELVEDEWKLVRFPLNAGATRDIPRNALFHESVKWRMQNDSSYHPQNSHGSEKFRKRSRAVPCLKNAQFTEYEDQRSVTLQASDRPGLPIRHGLYRLDH